MNASATLRPIQAPAIIDEPSPIVFIDSVPQPALRVVEWSIENTLDWRTAVLRLDETIPSAERALQIEHLCGGNADIAVPLRLSDESVRWLPLIQGQIDIDHVERRTGRDQVQFIVRDAWALVLAHPLPITWREDERGVLTSTRSPGTMLAGIRANRSTHRHAVGGHFIHVLSSHASVWSVLDALETLSAFANISLLAHTLAPDIAASPLTTDLDLSRPLAELFSAVMEPYGLTFTHTLTRHGGRIAAALAARNPSGGALHRLTWPTSSHLGETRRIVSHTPAARAARWIATASPPIIESTFTLIPGWTPASEGLEDDAYNRAINPEFSEVANTYRLWALNEDGRFTPPPFGRGPAFEPADFFEDEALRGARFSLRFISCLTLDEAGRRCPAIVESSLDGGEVWSRYQGDIIIRADLAGVYLDDAALPDAFLAAAKTGQARVRITAGLQSPRPLCAARWHGNPFRGTDQPRTLHAGNAFALRRVSHASIHRAPIDGGTLRADECDQSALLHAWLTQRVHQHATLTGTGRLTLELRGAHIAMRPGDRLRFASSPPLAPDTPAAPLPPTDATIKTISVSWPSASTATAPTTRLTLHTR